MTGFVRSFIVVAIGMATWIVALPRADGSSLDVRKRVLALGLNDPTSQMLFSESWGSLDAWPSRTGSATVVNGTLFLPGTVSSVAAPLPFLASADPYSIEFVWTPGSTMTSRFCLWEDATTCCGYISVENSLLYLASDRSLQRTAIDISSVAQGPGDGTYDDRPGARNWVAANTQRVTVIVNPAGRVCQWFLMYMGSDGSEQYAYLGQTTFTNPPATIQFLGQGASVTTVASPVRIQKVWGAFMGDSIAEGAPSYSPVPGSSGTLLASQAGYWIEQGLPGNRRVLNFGWRGQQVQLTGDRVANWIIGTGMKVAFILVGTNDCNSVQPNDSSTEWTRYDNMTVTRRASFTKLLSHLDAAGILCVICNIAPRPNYATTGGQSPSPPALRDPVATKALKDQWRHEHNSWLLQAVDTYNAIYVDIDAVVRDPTNPEWLLPAYNADNVHLTVAGYQAVGTAVLSALAVPIRVDINADGRVDVLDLLDFIKAFGGGIGGAKCDPACDFNDDGYVDVIDLLIMLPYFGT